MSKLFVSTFFVLLLLVSSGCSFIQDSWSSYASRNVAVNLSIDEIEMVGQSGGFDLKGTASLPDKTRLSIAAVRTLKEISSPDISENGPSYTILDRQFAVVEEGQWQADLSLRQLDGEGNSFESWQLNADLFQEDLTPSPTVLFMATLEPTSFSTDVEDFLTKAVINNGDSQLSYTSSGRPYLQVSQSMAIPMPSGKVPDNNNFTLVEADNIWQKRLTYSPEVDESNDTSQMPFTEEDNLPLPLSNMMQ
ncbi:MAG: hypothetical protein HC886_16915 [Leptolyngbyaceae cyanobacterium SM1_1_3]|nr:hypothetical protein [Leptolyngbyaceae cyanobacterium SM1_1_3]NJM85060.1 hypothetical protein [Leptolyngbyaceae cyanobacterium RM2_2_21]NJN01296.1 hypothetical protein [Leptolyngbyaceae cyanobacterium RM1_1_2]NJO10331.1 hypothetical protein [Leptolyngbyaceae cyanobacterium SL_1_1]